MGPAARRGTTLRREDGASAVEFALILIPLSLLLLGTIQYAWYFFVMQSTSSAAREGARRVVVGECWGSSPLTTFVKSQAPMVTRASHTPGSAGLASTAAPIGSMVTVTVEADGEIIGFLPMPNGGQVQRVFKARLEDKTPGDGSCP